MANQKAASQLGEEFKNYLKKNKLLNIKYHMNRINKRPKITTILIRIHKKVRIRIKKSNKLNNQVIKCNL